MALWQGKSQRKPTGGRRRYARGKRKFEISREVIPTIVAKEHKSETMRIRGGNHKTRVLRALKVNLVDPKTGKTKSVDVSTVKENPANPNYVQRNFVTKGAIIETSAGRARVTSRPGQDGVVNAVLVE
jgi:small subunit ribosomal protein S8e